MSRFNYGLAPAMFIVSGFAATQADAATTIQTFNQPASANANVFIGGSTTAQYRFTSGILPDFATIGNSAIGAKDSGQFPTSDTAFRTDTSADFIFPSGDLQLRFDIDGVSNLGLARFGQVPGGLTSARSNVADLDGRTEFGLITVEYGAAAAVPEPATWAMMFAGFGVMGASLRASRRRRDQAALA